MKKIKDNSDLREKYHVVEYLIVYKFEIFEY